MMTGLGRSPKRPSPDGQMKQVVFSEVSEDWQRDYLKLVSGTDFQPMCYDRLAQEVVKDLKTAEILSVFIKSKVDRSLLESLPRLKFIATRSTGYDHIDMKACRDRGILVSNVPVYGENTVAEHTFALILSLSRNLRKAYLKTLANDFSLDGLLGFDLKGKTLGVIGTGHIGLHVIRIGVSFGMKVLANDVREQKFLSEVLGFDYVPLEKLLEDSDIITLHVPYLPSTPRATRSGSGDQASSRRSTGTHHLINERTIRLIKKGSILINTARGGLVETAALVKALDEGILSGAGLDVLEEEEFILEEKRLLGPADSRDHWEKLRTTLGNHVLLHRDDVIYTPHMAFYSREAVQRILDTSVENVKAYLANHPIHVVS